MDLSCHANRLNERHPLYLMPGEEVHETPDGDLTEDHRQLHKTRHKIRYPHSITGAI